MTSSPMARTKEKVEKPERNLGGVGEERKELQTIGIMWAGKKAKRAMSPFVKRVLEKTLQK